VPDDFTIRTVLPMTTRRALAEQLAASKIECARLREENERLKQKLAAYGERPAVDQTPKEIVQSESLLPASTLISIHSPVKGVEIKV